MEALVCPLELVLLALALVCNKRIAETTKGLLGKSQGHVLVLCDLYCLKHNDIVKFCFSHPSIL